MAAASAVAEEERCPAAARRGSAKLGRRLSEIFG